MCSHVIAAEITITIIIIRWFRFGRKKEQKPQDEAVRRGQREKETKAGRVSPTR